MPWAIPARFEVCEFTLPTREAGQRGQRSTGWVSSVRRTCGSMGDVGVSSPCGSLVPAGDPAETEDSVTPRMRLDSSTRRATETPSRRSLWTMLTRPSSAR